MPLRGPRYSEAEAREAIAASLSVHGCAAPAGHAPGRRQPPRRSVATRRRSGASRSTTSTRTRCAAGGLYRDPVPLEAILVEGSTLPARPPEGAALRCGAEGARVRALRSGRDLARPPHVADPRPRQRRRRRQPPREPPRRLRRTATRRSTRTAASKNRLPVAERACLRCGATFSPRHERNRYCSRACGQRAHRDRRSPPGDAPRRAPALRPAPPRDRGARLSRRRTPLRRERQRHTQVATRVRIRGRRGVRTRRRRRPRNPWRLPPTNLIPVTAPTVVILAAGQGTRMRSRTPKMLHDLCGRPMVAWPIMAALEAGAGDVVVVGGPDGSLEGQPSRRRGARGAIAPRRHRRRRPRRRRPP